MLHAASVCGQRLSKQLFLVVPANLKWGAESRRGESGSQVLRVPLCNRPSTTPASPCAVGHGAQGSPDSAGGTLGVFPVTRRAGGTLTARAASARSCTSCECSFWQKLQPSRWIREMELLPRCSWCRAVRPYSEPLFTSARLLYSRCLPRQPHAR